MYIRPRRLWWFLPLFAALFLLGMALGKVTDKPQVKEASVEMDSRSQERANRAAIAALLDQVNSGEETPFQVRVKEQSLAGQFQGAAFELGGDIHGHQLKIKRTEDQVTVAIDGEEQEGTMTLPFSLYTPYEHMTVIKSHLEQVKPLPLKDAKKEGLLGYQFSLPPGEVKAMLSTWLGPQFPTEQVFQQFLQQVAVTYQMWYDEKTSHLRQLVVSLKISGPNGGKQDQLIFLL
ncbi:hypothetical protein ACI7RC_11310 [Brevibacillus sp. B_LB10_24]|uniref:hypothetical protein n=1 Tax=Brevibacillus sp. B_LB10_24 TaxID=3380645 RepID=UPI0038BB2D58